MAESHIILLPQADYFKWRALPQWIYSASDHVNRALNTKPDKMAFNLAMPYRELRFRFDHTSGTGMQAFNYQNLANGAFPTFVVLGTMDQPDKTVLKAVRPVFEYYDKYKMEYLEQKNASRVILYASQDPSWNRENSNYRGFFRLLTELHIPFKVTNIVEGLKSEEIDLIIIPEGSTPQSLLKYIEDGGAVLVAGTEHPGFTLNKSVKLWENVKSSYMRIEDHSLFPLLKDTWVMFWEGDYLELETSKTPVTLIPPGQFGTPEKVSALNIKTDKPGLILKDIAKGKIAYIPWDIGNLYYHFSNDKHRMFISDLIDYLLADKKRQIKTNAHPSVEITLMKQEKLNRTLIHMINLVGHSGTAFFEAVEMRNIFIDIKGDYSKAVTLDSKMNLEIKKIGDYSRITIPSLLEFSSVVLYK